MKITARHRPVAVVGSAAITESYVATSGPQSSTGTIPLLAPFGAVEIALAPQRPDGATRAWLLGPDGTELAVELTDGRVSLSITTPAGTERRRSRRRGRPRCAPTRLALSLTGTHVAALTCEDGAWVVRGRVDLADGSLPGAPDVRDADWLAGLSAGWASGRGTVSGWTAGSFGQLGLRDTRLVSHADGSAYRLPDGSVLFSATSAGPGFFGTAHTSLWELDVQGEVRHRAALYFQRPDAPGGYGDHATHVVRDGERWLVATSTWSDFPSARREREHATVAITLAETKADITRGEHLLGTRTLDLPTDGPSVGVWDPHLAREEDGSWLVGYVSARRFFDFHPLLARGPSLEELTLLGAATDRRASEGTTLLRTDAGWRVLASDGRDNTRRVRERFPVFDLAMREIETLEAPYPTNIPWPSVIAPNPAVPGDEWRMVTFDGTPSGGALAGYGTHGDVIVMGECRD
ncbi:hypothetical protein ASE01_05520 [Nocardioides sp. Root190]|nr:hypothetical protein ASE01_05520 [Nocardioides sp. Root190]